MKKEKSHNELLESLSEAKESIFVDLYLGSKYQSVYVKEDKLPRADLVVVRPSYTRFCIDIYEVKQSRQDFLSDIRTKKWEQYLPYCHRFYFACAPEVLHVRGKTDYDAVPDEAGLIMYSPLKKSWWTKKAPPERNIEPNMEMLMALIFYRRKGYKERYRRAQLAKIGDIRSSCGWNFKEFGKQVAKAIDHCRYCDSYKGKSRIY